MKTHTYSTTVHKCIIIKINDTQYNRYRFKLTYILSEHDLKLTNINVQITITFFFFFDLVLEDFREDADVVSSRLFLDPLFVLDLFFLLRTLLAEPILFAGGDV